MVVPFSVPVMVPSVMHGVFCTEIVPLSVEPVWVKLMVKVPEPAGLVFSYVPFHVPATAPDAGAGVVETAPPGVLALCAGAEGVEPPPPPPQATPSVATARSGTVNRMSVLRFMPASSRPRPAEPLFTQASGSPLQPAGPND